jgi:hypothetical protein
VTHCYWISQLKRSSFLLALLDAGVLEQFTGIDDINPRWVWAAAIVSSCGLPMQNHLNHGDTVATLKPNIPMEFQSPPDIWDELGDDPSLQHDKPRA